MRQRLVFSVHLVNADIESQPTPPIYVEAMHSGLIDNILLNVFQGENGSEILVSSFPISQLDQDFIEAITNYLQFSKKSAVDYTDAMTKLGRTAKKGDYMGLAMLQQSELAVLRSVVNGVRTIVDNYKSMKQEKARQ